MIDDIVFPNNSNVLVIDEEATKKSEEGGRLYLGCWYREPYLADQTVKAAWRTAVIGWDELTFDLVAQQAYLYDDGGQESALAATLNQKKIDRVRDAETELRHAVIYHFATHRQRTDYQQLP